MVYTKATKYGLVPKRSMSVGIKPDIPSFDLSKINVVQLAKDLSVQINQKQPKGWLRKWWVNQKLPMDNQRLSHLNDYINEIQRVNSSITDMQAELFVQPQILQYVIEKRLIEARQQIEIEVKRHEREINKYTQEINRDKLETARVQAEIRNTISQTRIVDLQGKLLEKLIDDLDIKNITPEIAIIIIKALDPNAQVDLASATNHPLIKSLVDKMEQQTRSLKVQADMDENIAEHQRGLLKKK
ncbi:hypothetical protein [uncultured Desulfosarcina sp.]|uniref:hypothetical protein n=1 Tax=uncultured Desulfosarcina sp. TaxID=218289 RepID=UPI0029C76151|nr:hypothetical protein [uncultured Desulfosarcina sp.]